MAVLIEGICVVVRNAAIEARCAGGRVTFDSLLAGLPHWGDDELTCVRFDSRDGAGTFIDRCSASGLLTRQDGQWRDLAMLYQLTGPSMPAPWLETARMRFGETDVGRILVCWQFEGNRKAAGLHLPSRRMSVVMPAGWKHHESLSIRFRRITEQMSPRFRQCWQDAGAHLERQAGRHGLTWLRAIPSPVFDEHLSFVFGRQLYFVHIVDEDDPDDGPGTITRLRRVAAAAGGHACLLPMRRNPETGIAHATGVGWGLVRADDDRAVEPGVLATPEAAIEMTPWEVQDLAVQIVREALHQQDRRLLAWHGHPNDDPSIWLVDADGEPAWVVVRPAIYPITSATRPKQSDVIAASGHRVAARGYFASVEIANAAQQSRADGSPALPLLRGQELHVAFGGLE